MARILRFPPQSAALSPAQMARFMANLKLSLARKRLETDAMSPEERAAALQRIEDGWKAARAEDEEF